MLKFIVNPVAGNGRALRVMKDVENQLKDRSVSYSVEYTSGPGHATDLAKDAAEQGFEGIAVVGGDGTVLEVVNGLLGYGVPLGIIPGGTGNDFINSIGVSQDPMEALNTVLQKHTSRFDVGLVNGKAFLNVAGMGFDVDVIVNNRHTRKFLKGMAAYFAAVLIAVFKADSKRVKLSLKNKKLDRDIFLMAVANGRCYAGGMMVAPDASVQDELLDVVLINKIPRWRIPLILPKFIKGKHFTLDVVEHFKCSWLEVSSEDHFPLNLDGELLGNTPAHFGISDEKVSIFVPQGAS